MNLFVHRETSPEQTQEAVELTRPEAPAGRRLERAYWTPGDGEVLSVFSGVAGEMPPGSLPVVPVTPEEYGPPAVTPLAPKGELPLALVRRRLGPLGEDDFRAIALQAIMCAYEYPDMRWLRSYWSRETEQLFCLFETRDHELIRDHARRSRIPCDEVHNAVELRLEGTPPE